jgi:hypothetical protein
MQNVKLKKGTPKMAPQKTRAFQIPAACEGIPDFMIRIARERQVKISEEPTMPKYRHD